MKNFGIMLYVDNVNTEKDFWSAVGFNIINESDMMGFPMFEMKSHPESTTTFTVFDKEFIRQNSPEVVDNQPSIMFDTDDLEGFHALVKNATEICNDIQEVPFKHFNFATPNGSYYAVREV